MVSFDFKSNINLPCVTTKLASTNYDDKMTTHFFGIVPENRLLCANYYVFDELCEQKKVDMIASALIMFLDANIAGFDMLYLFCDNTVSQNKNRFIVALLCMMRLRYNLIEIRLNFMVVGHTHMKVDMCFGRVQKCLKMKNLFTSYDIVAAINGNGKLGKCYYVERTLRLHDLFDAVPPATGITAYYHTIKINGSGVYASIKTLGQRRADEQVDRKYWDVKLPSLQAFNKFIGDPLSLNPRKTFKNADVQKTKRAYERYANVTDDALRFITTKMSTCTTKDEEEMKKEAKKKAGKK